MREVVGSVIPGGSSDGPGGVTDILLLATLPFRRRPKMLPFDSFDLPPRLSLGSLAVTPLKPVDVGDGCILCEDDLDGTWRRLRCFFGTAGASSATGGKSFSFNNSDGASESPVLAVFCAVDVVWVEELGGCGVFVKLDVSSAGGFAAFPPSTEAERLRSDSVG